MEVKERPQLKICGESSRPYGETREVSYRIEGLLQSEADEFQRMFLGLAWITVREGKVIARPAVETLPEPAADEKMLPFWRPLEPHFPGRQYKLSLEDTELQEKQFCGSIFISGLCGYYYTQERYREEADKLVSYGFECMRSRRGEDGEFWEIWYLPGVWAAKGNLKHAVSKAKKESGDIFKDHREELDLAVGFLRKHCIFGSLDTSIQRLAMMVPD